MEQLSLDARAIIGTMKRNALCKICKNFGERNPKIFSEITRDIHMGTKIQDIIDTYSVYLPEDVSPLNRANIINHRYHTDPKKLLRAILKDPTNDKTEGRVIVQLLEEVSGEQLDRERVMEGLNMARLQDMGDLEVVLLRNRSRWQKFMNLYGKFDDSMDVGGLDDSALVTKELERLEGRMMNLVERRHALWNSMHSILLSEMKNSREAVASKLRNEIYRMMVENLNLHLVSFMKEVSDILINDEFAEHPDRGISLFRRLTKAMNTNLQPMMKDFTESGMVDAKFEDVQI